MTLRRDNCKRMAELNTADGASVLSMWIRGLKVSSEFS